MQYNIYNSQIFSQLCTHYVTYMVKTWIFHSKLHIFWEVNKIWRNLPLVLKSLRTIKITWEFFSNYLIFRYYIQNIWPLNAKTSKFICYLFTTYVTLKECKLDLCQAKNDIILFWPLLILHTSVSSCSNF